MSETHRPHPAFPTTRMRRVRSADWSRRLVAEHHLNPSDLILPMFLIEGEGKREPVPSMPGVERHTVDMAVRLAAEAAEAGIPAIALFPNTPANLKTDDGREACNPENLACRAVRAIKAEVPRIGIMCDVALDPYTTHGHDGLFLNGAHPERRDAGGPGQAGAVSGRGGLRHRGALRYDGRPRRRDPQGAWRPPAAGTP